MKEFNEWYYYVKSDGKSWPSFGRYDTDAERLAAEEAWRAALEFAEEQVGNDYHKGYKAIKEELNAKT